jgi:hypothetical protein
MTAPQPVPRLTEIPADGNSILVVKHRFEATVLGDPLHARDILTKWLG